MLVISTLFWPVMVTDLAPVEMKSKFQENIFPQHAYYQSKFLTANKTNTLCFNL